MYDLTIVGGGPAGAAAAVYAARKQLKTLMVVEEWGGQSNVSPDVQNWVGTKSISGADLAKSLREHAEVHVADGMLEIRTPVSVQSLAVTDDHVTITLKDGSSADAKTLFIATGSTRRKLEIPGAKEFDQKGLTYCASCDGPLFTGKDVAVIGGGNAAFETAAQLLAYAKSVVLLNRSDILRADEITVAKVLANTKMKALKNAEPIAVIGEKFVKGLQWRDVVTKKEETLPVEGIFVEIGLLPNTAWLGNAVELNQFKQVKVEPRTQKASHSRVWAAGDCTDGLYHQNNIAAGDAVKALEDIYLFLHAR